MSTPAPINWLRIAKLTGGVLLVLTVLTGAARLSRLFEVMDLLDALFLFSLFGFLVYAYVRGRKS